MTQQDTPPAPVAAPTIGNEFRTFGPPGTGKTTTLSAQIRSTAGHRGPDSVMVASFTAAAAREIASRDLPLRRSQVGTLHSFAYSAIDRPGVAEEHLVEWNREFPALALSIKPGQRQNMDESPAEWTGATDGDELMGECETLRAKMVDRALWPRRAQHFYKRFEEWKAHHGVVDFTDMIEGALEGSDAAPGRPEVGFFDEAQDFTKLEMTLVRHWGQSMERVILAGDDDQMLYAFKGAQVESMLEPALPPEQVRILDQSYRVPREVHAVAQHWVERLSRREPKNYLPRDEDGVARLAPFRFSDPSPLVRDVVKQVEAGRSVMLLASCAYMLDAVKHELRAQGLPFHNPYRRCSPPDEPVLTDQGYVPIGELDPARHRLVGYYAKTNSLSRGPNWSDDLETRRPSGPDQGRRRGFDFTVGRKPYSGPLLVFTTPEGTRTRVTPNHRMRVRFGASAGHSVYLMRRGQDWRVGMTLTNQVSSRLRAEGGDAAWILSTHWSPGIYEGSNSRTEATIVESSVQARYGLSGVTFTAHRPVGAGWTQAMIDGHHRGLRDESSERARKLLADYGRLEEEPLFTAAKAPRAGYAFETVAANLVPGMEVPLPSNEWVAGRSSREAPAWAEAEVEVEHYDGDVYSLDVPGPEHYVSGGIVVHNSRGDWNPLKPSRGVSSVERLLAYLAPDERVFGDDARLWTGEDVRRWSHALKASEVFRRGAKAAVAALPDGELPYELVADLFRDEHHLERGTDPDLDWFASHLLAGSRPGMEYPVQVARRRGAMALTTEPLVTIGTMHCSPPDEPVLTSEGYVPMGDLDPEKHALVSYTPGSNRVVHGPTNARGGFAFEKSVRPYRGDLVRLDSGESYTRVTPNHVVRARFTEDFEGRWVVYLMRRGDWWRVGVCTSAHRPYRSGGVGGRLATEKADGGWVLGVYETRREALIAEAQVQGRYGVPGLTFQSSKARSLDDADLAAVHDAIAPELAGRVVQLLRDYGLLADAPLYTRAAPGEGTRKRNLGGWFDTEACNLVALSGRVAVPVYVAGQRAPVEQRATVTTAPYDGVVYGLDVKPHHYYVSGGAVVHNSVKGGQADVVYVCPELSRRAFKEWAVKGDPRDSVIRLFYVALTRAREEVVVCHQNSQVAVDPALLMAGRRPKRRAA